MTAPLDLPYHEAIEEGATRMSEPVICITGGASGMGFATARKFDAEGWRAILIDLSEHQLEQAKQALSARTTVSYTHLRAHET